MKTLNNSSLTLREALNLIIEQGVRNTLNIATDDNQITNEEIDIQKKSRTGVVTDYNDDTGFQVKLDTGEIIFITVAVYGVNPLPRVNSRVLIGYEEDNTPYFVNVYDPSDIKLTAADSSYIELVQGTLGDDQIGIRIGDALLKLNGTNYGGLIIVAELVAKLNELTAELRAFKTLFNAHTHTSSAPTNPSSPPLTTLAADFSNFSASDFTNNSVQHGTNINQ